MKWYNPFSWGQKQLAPPILPEKKTIVPPGRSSRPTFGQETYVDIKSRVTFIDPGYIAQYIPIIRKMSWINPDVGVAVNDMVQLTNTGHKIKFDPGVTSEQQDAMRGHLVDKQKIWGDGVAGMNGLINKMIAQIWIGGALSTEWIVSNDLKGIDHVAFVNPETIRFQWNKKKLRFFPYQKQDSSEGSIVGEKMVKLNINTYKYFGLNGDTDIPYGIPPYLTALNALTVQSEMDSNIRFIMKQLGLLGFTQLLMAKPGQTQGESDAAYKARLITLLEEAKNNVLEGVKDGIVAGFEEDHQFEFNSTTKNLNGVSDLYNQNETQVANGLKMAAEFIGAGHSGTETGISIIFTKMLSQLQNVQNLVAANLRHGYALELRLAGFTFRNLSIEFKPSTITDELKLQQAQEYQIRNTWNLYSFGQIGMQQAADILGLDKPDQSEPRWPISGAQMEQEERQDQNNKSDKKTRDKKKSQSKNMLEFLATFPEELLNEFLDFHNSK